MFIFFCENKKKGRVVRRERQSKERQEIEIAENERHLPQNSNRTPSRRKSNKNRKKNCKKIDFPKSRVNLPPIKKCLEERLGLKVLARCQDIKKNKQNESSARTVDPRNYYDQATKRIYESNQDKDFFSFF